MSLKHCDHCMQIIDLRTQVSAYTTDYGAAFCNNICYSLYFDNESYERTSRDYSEDELDSILHTGRSADCE